MKLSLKVWTEEETPRELEVELAIGGEGVLDEYVGVTDAFLEETFSAIGHTAIFSLHHTLKSVDNRIVTLEGV